MPDTHDGPKLTAREWAMVRELIRAEARRIGYGTLYTEPPRWSLKWPRRLYQLRTIMRKIGDHDPVRTS